MEKKNRRGKRKSSSLSIHACVYSFPFSVSQHMFFKCLLCVTYLAISSRHSETKNLCPWEADILATHPSYLSQWIGVKSPLEKPLRPPSLVTFTLLLFVAIFSFTQDPSCQGSSQLFAIFSPQWGRILRAGISKQNSQRQTNIFFITGLCCHFLCLQSVLSHPVCWTSLPLP